MGDVVNLKRARKNADRAKAGKTAEVNRVKFGRTKAEKQRDAASLDRVAGHVDAHRLDPSKPGDEGEP